MKNHSSHETNSGTGMIRRWTIAVACAAISWTNAAEPYADQLAALRSEITTKLPAIDDAARKSIVEAKDAKARVEALRKLTALNPFIASDALDAKLAKCFILHEATPAALDAFANQNPEKKKLLDDLLSDEQLMLQIALADGARPLHVRQGATAPNYGRAMELYSAIQAASPQAKEGVHQRLALAVALEFSEAPEPEEDAGEAAKAIDPLKRYHHFEKAYEAGELDPNFPRLSVWELRFVVCAPESDAALAWGREMLRNYRPDHISTTDEGWRYANVVNTDVRYGSIDVGKDRPELMGPQNILMNGGICGRRAFFARYICRAFGIPATARPSSGHGASARWSPQGWVVVLGPGWGNGRTATRYQNDLDFLATTQARARGGEFSQVMRAWWIADAMGESRTHGEQGNKTAPAFWNGVALATQGRIIEDAKAVPLEALGAELGEASGPSNAGSIKVTPLTPEDKNITQQADGSIIIPAVAFTQSTGSKDEDDEGESDVLMMDGFAGGKQVFLPTFLQQKPILVRGGSHRHQAAECESATRHWRGRRPKNSTDLRGLRVVVSLDGNETAKELTLKLSEDVTMDFVYIPAGTFTMGGTRQAKEGEISADTPRHEVTLSKGFYMGKTEVTQAQYGALMDKKPNEGADFPMQGVKPFTALLFCENLSAKTGREVRLPTEAEWEYAARAGTNTRWFFGDDAAKLGDYAWFKDNAQGKIQPVGQKKPNPWGLYDIYGNVAEFVRDEHQENYYAHSPKVDPTGPSLGIHASMTYNIEVPQAGDYTLTAKVVTSNVEQSLQLGVNGDASPSKIALPFTIGAWGESTPITIKLQQGKNTLHFWRDQAPQFGVALKAFTLKPAGGKNQ